MPIYYEKPVGAHADCKELEYIATLHQTGEAIRSDGSITAEDVSNFLTSRHGIRVDPSYIETHLMPSLAGAMDESSEAVVFDIVEIASMLLIPHLRKAAAAEDEYAMQDFFQKVLKMIVGDVTGESDRIVLNKSTMREILEFYGEDAVPEEIIDEMLEAAAGADPKNDTEFDFNNLIAATTGDIQQIDLDWANTPTTHYDDVLDGTTLDANLEDNDPDEEIAKSNFDSAGNEVQRIFTFPTIDFVAENYRSKTFNIILWLLVIVAFFAYAFQFQTAVGRQDCNVKFRSEFGCRVVNSIISWLLIFAQLTILGSLFVTLSTAGNSIYLQHSISSLFGVMVGIITITFSCILSYIFEIEFFLINTMTAETQQDHFAQICALALGCVLLAYQVKSLFFVLIPRGWYERMSFTSFFLNTDMARCERATKQAAAFKIGRMVENAMGHHEGDGLEYSSKRLRTKSSSKANAFSQALLNFQATANCTEPTGGIIFTFKNLLNGTLFNEEGVWLHARLYAMNLSQWFVAIFYLVLYVFVLSLFKDVFSETLPPTVSPAPTAYFGTQDLVNALAPQYVPVLEQIVAQGEDFLSILWANMSTSYPELVTALGGTILNYTSTEVLEELASNANAETLEKFVMTAAQMVEFQGLFNVAPPCDGDSRFLQEITGEDSLESLLPTQRQATFATTMGGIAAFIATVSLAMVWLPSSVSTIQQFRCGAIPSLHDKQFYRYRKAPDLTTILFGSTFWGTFYSSGVIFIIIGGLSFVLVWEFTRPVVVSLLANVIGIFVTIAAKMLILIFVRKALFVGFYRKRPAGGNFMLLIFECWSLGLTVGTMAVRMVKLILISAFYIGRLDTPLFAPGVGNIGPFQLDNHPIQFRKDLLLHDAHRHPYIERLGVIYILKLRYGDAFGSRAGGAWRLIFTMALMPWLRRYRLQDGLTEAADDDTDRANELESALDAKLTISKLQDDKSEKKKSPRKNALETKKAELTRLRKRVMRLEANIAKAGGGENEFSA